MLNLESKEVMLDLKGTEVMLDLGKSRCYNWRRLQSKNRLFLSLEKERLDRIERSSSRTESLIILSGGVCGSSMESPGQQRTRKDRGYGAELARRSPANRSRRLCSTG